MKRLVDGQDDCSEHNHAAVDVPISFHITQAENASIDFRCKGECFRSFLHNYLIMEERGRTMRLRMSVTQSRDMVRLNSRCSKNQRTRYRRTCRKLFSVQGPLSVSLTLKYTLLVAMTDKEQVCIEECLILETSALHLPHCRGLHTQWARHPDFAGYKANSKLINMRQQNRASS